MRRVMKRARSSKLKKLNRLRKRLAKLGLPGLDACLVLESSDGILAMP